MSDGTVAGTRELFDLVPGYVPTCTSQHCEPYFPTSVTPVGDQVFFVARSTGSTGAALGCGAKARRRSS